MLYAIIITISLIGLLYTPSPETFLAALYIATTSLPLLLISNPINNMNNHVTPKNTKIIILISIILGLININVIAESVGASLADALSIDGITSIAVKSTMNRYEIDTQANSGNPIILALSLSIVYITKLSTRGLGPSLLVLSPILLYTVYTTEKWPSFLGLIFLLAGLLMGDRNERRLNLFKLLIFSIFIIIVMVLSMLIRSSGGAVVEDILPQLMHYLFSQYYGLGYWIINRNSDLDLSLGKSIFMGPLHVLGVSKREAGAGFENYQLNGLDSNIYTAYRYIIEDFGIMSPIIINAALALTFQLSMRIGFIKFPALMYIFLLFCALLSLNVTPFVHNTTAMGILICMFYTLRHHKETFTK